MNKPELYRYTDAEGDLLFIGSVAGAKVPTVSFLTGFEGEPVHVPAADVDAVVAAIYTAAGRKPPRLDPIQECDTCHAGYTLGQPCQTCAFNTRMAAEQAARSL